MATLTKEKNGSWNIRFVDDHGNRQSVFLKSRYTEQSANDLKRTIETIIFCRDNHQQPDKRVMTYLETAPPDILKRLEKAGLIAQTKIRTLAQLWDAFEVEYVDTLKDNTKRIYGQTRSKFFLFFKSGDSIDKVTKQSLSEWKAFLKKTYSTATVSIDIAKVKRLLNWATDEKDLFVKSPGKGVKKESCVQKDRMRFITMADYESLLAACTTQEQRTILTLARIGGLRIPSEITTLTWDDVNWEKHRLWIKSPKTEHHEDKKGRWVPLWEPIRRELEALYFVDDADGKDDRVFKNRGATSNLRTRFEKIQKRAGLTPIPKFFTNCRSTRSTEVYNEYGALKESMWIGHSTKIAERHYLQLRDEDYVAAAGKSGAKVALDESNLNAPCSQKCYACSQNTGAPTPVESSIPQETPMMR